MTRDAVERPPVAAVEPRSPVPGGLEHPQDATGPTVAFEVAVPLHRGKPPLTHNQRLHWREKAARTRSVRDAVAWAVKALRHPCCARVTVQLHYAPGDNRRRDSPNLTATSKPAIDGLVDAGLVADDSDGYVTEVMPVCHPGPGERRLWLAVRGWPLEDGEDHR